MFYWIQLIKGNFYKTCNRFAVFEVSQQGKKLFYWNKTAYHKYYTLGEKIQKRATFVSTIIDSTGQGAHKSSGLLKMDFLILGQWKGKVYWSCKGAFGFVKTSPVGDSLARVECQ